MSLYDILMSENVSGCVRENIDDLIINIPELKYIIGFPQNHPHHHLDVFEHTLLALSLSEEDFDVRLSLLLHDIGKPFSYQDEEVRHFRGHALVSSFMCKKILTRLGFDKDYIKRIVYLVKNHDSEITKEMFLEDKELVRTLYKVQKADALAHNPKYLKNRKSYLRKTNKLIMSKS